MTATDNTEPIEEILPGTEEDVTDETEEAIVDEADAAADEFEEVLQAEAVAEEPPEAFNNAEPESGSADASAADDTASAALVSDADEDMRMIIEALIFASDEPIPFRQIRDVLFPSDDGARALPFDDTDAVEADDVEAGAADVTAEAADAAAGKSADASEADVVESIEAAAPRGGKTRKKQAFTINTVQRHIESLNHDYAQTGRPFRIVEIAGGFTFQTIASVGGYVGRLFAERTKRRLTQSALETLAIIAFRQPISKPAVEAIRGVNADYVLKSLLEKNLIAIVGRENSVGRPLLYGTTKVFLKHFGLNSLDDLPRPREIQDLLAEESDLAARPIEERDEFLEEPQHFGEGSLFETLPLPLPPAESSDTTDQTASHLPALPEITDMDIEEIVEFDVTLPAAEQAGTEASEADAAPGGFDDDDEFDEGFGGDDLDELPDDLDELPDDFDDEFEDDDEDDDEDEDLDEDDQEENQEDEGPDEEEDDA